MHPKRANASHAKPVTAKACFGVSLPGLGRIRRKKRTDDERDAHAEQIMRRRLPLAEYNGHNERDAFSGGKKHHEHAQIVRDHAEVIE